MTFRRGDGWPRLAAALGLVLCLLPAWGRHWAGLGLGLLVVVTLLAWRRGLSLESRWLTHWWGFQLPLLGVVRCRTLREQSVEGLDSVRVESLEKGHHYKAKPMYRVVMEKAEDPLSRVVIDDEFDSVDQAEVLAEKVRQHLKST